MDSVLLQSPLENRSPDLTSSTETPYEPMLRDSIKSFIAGIHRDGFDFAGFRSVISRHLHSSPNPPLIIVWLYSAAIHHETIITKSSFDRARAARDLLHLLSAFSASFGGAKSIALIAPVVYVLHRCAAEGEEMEEVERLAEGVLSYVSICSGHLRDLEGGSMGLLHPCFLDIVKVWTVRECGGEGGLEAFFPLVGREARRRFEVEGFGVGYLAGVVIAEGFLPFPAQQNNNLHCFNYTYHRQNSYFHSSRLLSMAACDRIRLLNPIKTPPATTATSSNPIIYWMFRDQRSHDNWALIHSIHLANLSSAPVAVAFNLSHRFLNAHARQLGFMLRGLSLLRRRLLRDLGIPFFLLRGDPADTIPQFLRECGAGALVTDFSPLRRVREWKEEICGRVGEGVGVYEVDAHNVVPVWVASDKLEYGARTIRRKIQRVLAEYLVEFPELLRPDFAWALEGPKEIDWDDLLAEVLREGCEVPEIEWCQPGEDAAMEVLMGAKEGFLTKRLKNYSVGRNNPMKPRALSCLSPYLHFGQISAQRCALEALKLKKSHPQAVDAFLEELIVRRELADNFCYYQPHYDSVLGAWDWARRTLMDHAADKREHIYTRDELENAITADPLWNASQLEMVHHGKMHGFMRMYWAKKILEWTNGPEEALAIAIYLNDKYEIDGRDPNGYVGCMWSICGVHDQGWKERAVFGKIRYMNYAGCKRKFDVDGYIAYVRTLVANSKKRKAENTKSLIGKISRT